MCDNYYNILGINENASKEDIKKAYRKKQIKFHPDRNPDDMEASNMTRKLNEAYETLGDDQKREEYDMSRKNPFMKMNFNNQHGNSMDIPINEIFNNIFGGFHQNMGIPHPFGGGIPGFHGGIPNGFLQKPTPIVKNIFLTLEQVLDGATIPIEIQRWIIENNNKVFENETVYINVPQGIDDGEMIILQDKGNILNENVKGDIKIFFKINNNTNFKRKGLDLIFEKNISLKEALCGFSFEIKYINGKSYTLNNNKGNIIPPEYCKIYNNMGLKRGDHTGNLIIHFHIDFPESLNDEQIVKLSEIL
jgi:DnaJ-class molecular chaperone